MPSLASSVRVFWSWVVSARPRESRSPVWRRCTKDSGQHLELGEIIDAQRLQDAGAGILHVVAVQVAEEAAEEEDQRDVGGDEGDGAERKAAFRAVEDRREHILDHARQAGARGGAVEQAGQDGREQGVRTGRM
jgi:hypothetical protein